MGERDEEAIEQAGRERRLAQGGDDHREIDVRGQDALAVGEQRIGPRKPAVARQDLGDHQFAVRPRCHPQPVSDREVALLHQRQRLGQVAEHDLATHLDLALAAGDRDHQGLAGQRRLVVLGCFVAGTALRHRSPQALGAAEGPLRTALPALLAQREIVVVVLVQWSGGLEGGCRRQSCAPVRPALRA